MLSIITNSVPNYMLLTHPNIPKPLHGLNPRSLLGQQWWDGQRFAAYKKFNYRCWACGGEKGTDPYRPWLEGHESYQYDYNKGTATLVEVSALCYSCHSFIHSGRLWMLYKAGKVSGEEIRQIIGSRMNLVLAAHLQPFSGTVKIWALLATDPYTREKREQLYLDRQKEASPHCHVNWEDWRLVVYGHKYPPLVKSMEEWERKYGGH